MRKLGLLWVLVQNGVLQGGSVLFWDAPETNLNPSLFGEVIEVLLELQRIGVQVFLATHDYVILKELDLRAKSRDKVVLPFPVFVGRNRRNPDEHRPRIPGDTSQRDRRYLQRPLRQNH